MSQLSVAFNVLSYILAESELENFTAPILPELPPEEAESFAQGLWKLVSEAIRLLRPELATAAGLCLSVLAMVLLLSMLQPMEGRGKWVSQLVGTFGISVILLEPASSMIRLASDTIVKLTEYNKLLLPVMTGALAAQGGVSKSTALYAGTAILNSLLSSFHAAVLVPLIHMYLVLACANSVIGDDSLQRLQGFLKSASGWMLKTTISLFTGYMGLTGIIHGTADAAALKAAKITLTGAVPVVGGALSEAAETVLVSAGILKNAAGVYGMLAIFAIGLRPFLQIALPYLLLKLTAGISGIFSDKRVSSLIQDYAGAMGLLLAITGTICLLFLISTVCFMKGVA